MANDTVKATTRLFKSIWAKECSRDAATGRSLVKLATGFDRQLTVEMVENYMAVLAALTQQEIILAFTRAMEECKYFPPPALLLELSGRGVDGDPVEREAKEALVYLLNGMRTEHGPRLQTLPGPLLRVEEEWRDGERFKNEILGDRTPFPLTPRQEAALKVLGWGSRTKGIAIIATHPGVSETKDFNDDEQYRGQPLRAADDILKRWIEAYRAVGRYA